MGVFEELSWRGLVHQTTHDELGAELERGPVTFYAGFDPTADSLHVGSLLPLMCVAHLQNAGHRPIVLMGGGTGLIGDPSGKTAERQLLDREAVEANIAGQRAQIARIVSFEGPNAAKVLNNAEWLCSLGLVDFLRDIGKHFSVNVMLTRESVRQRLEDRDHGMSYTEFSYSLLQAYDFLHLCRTHACRLQVGGSDQWGNIVSGMDLTRRLLDTPTYGLTWPLVTKSDGAKFGKSESGNIWLDPKRTSPYRFYQFWINQADQDTPRCLRYFTFLEEQEIRDLEACIDLEPQKRTAQRKLAEEVTRMVHGEDALAMAVKASEAMFSGEIRGLAAETLEDIFSEVPSATLSRSVLDAGTPLLDTLVKAGCFKSKGEARRMLKNGGLYLNGEKLATEEARLWEIADRLAVVRIGKKSYHLLKFVG